MRRGAAELVLGIVLGAVAMPVGALAGPVEDAAHVEVLRHLPAYWQVENVKAGTPFAGRTPLEIKVRLDVPVFVTDARIGGVTFVRPGAAPGLEKTLYGAATEVKSGPGRAIRVDLLPLGDVLDAAGKPLEALPGRIVLADSEEGRTLRATLEADDGKALTNEKERRAREEERLAAQTAADKAKAIADEAERKALEARTKKLAAISERLAGRDAAARLAAVESALAGDDATIRQLAVATALQSKDPVLAGLAIKDWLARHKTIPVQLFATKEDRNSADVLANLGPLTLTVDSVDRATGNLTATLGAPGYGVAQPSAAVGGVTRSDLTLNTYGCTLQLHLSDQRTLEGLYRCQTLATLAARIALD